MAKGFGDGTRIYQQRGKEALPILAGRAKAGRDITYGQLGQEMGVHPHALADALGAVGYELEELRRKWKERIPAINCLVVNKTKRTPGQGINFVMPFKKFQLLTPLAKKKVMRELYTDIWGYPKWDAVLKHFGIPPVVPANTLEPIATKAKYGKGGGETEDHRTLKAYLASNPQRLGLPKNALKQEEYPFISVDRIDILFKCRSTWVGVEVKGSNADEPELMRGIFQCVKYQALIEATQRYEQKTVDGQVILAIGGKLFQELSSLADLLEVKVVESIAVPTAFLKTVAKTAAV